MVRLALRELEGQVAMKGGERGQSVLLFAVLLALMVLFLLGILDYMVTNARLMEAVAVSDLAAHAGAQEIRVLPNGQMNVTGEGSRIAALYFNAQHPDYTRLASVVCGIRQGRPACEVTARVRSTGHLLPARWLMINAVGYLSNGVTRGDQ